MSVTLTPSAPAVRGTSSRWKDGRIIGGVALIIVSVIVGALLMRPEPSKTWWAAAHNIAPGSVVTEADLVAIEASVPEDLYLQAEMPIPQGVANGAISQGALIARGAIVTQANEDVRLVSVPVSDRHAPVDLAQGDRVDVWNSADTVDGIRGPAVLALKGVVVAQVATSEVSDGVGVLLEVPTDQVGVLVSALTAGEISLVRIPVGAS